MAIDELKHAHNRCKRLATLIATALILPVLLAGTGLALEYRDQRFSLRIGQYLLAHNDQRPLRGAVWDAILGDRSGHLGLIAPAVETIDAGSIPTAILRWDYSIEIDATALVMESSRRDTIIEPGSARRADFQALATSLHAYRLGQDLLHQAAMEAHQYRQRADQRLDSLLSDGRLFLVIDQQLTTQQVPDAYLLEPMSTTQRQRWQERLQQWRRNRQPSMHSGLTETLGKELDWETSRRERGSQQERVYQRICNDLLENWTDSLYTADFLRLTDGWSNGGGYSAVATREQSGWRGRAFLGNGDVLEFVIPLVTQAQNPIDTSALGSRDDLETPQ